MAQPPPYTPGTDFSAEEANAVGGRSTVRTAQLDAELAALEVTADAICANLALIQRDDGEVRDGKVKLHTLASDVKRLLTTYDCVVRGAWLTATEYALKDVVTEAGVTYLCAVKHTSGVFATDLAATKWLALSSTLATDVAFTPQAGIAASNVEAALVELGNQVGDGAASINFRNRIINGDMRIDQRNNGVAVNIGGFTAYASDRWLGLGTAAAGAFSIQRMSTGTPPAGFSHYFRAAVTTQDASLAATDVYYVAQRIEGFNIADFEFGSAGAKTITLSFRVRSSVAGTFGGALNNSGSTRSYPFTFTIVQANTWETKTITVAGDTAGTWLADNGIGLSVIFGLGVGSTYSGTAGAWAGANYASATGVTNLMATLNATFDITGVQLEAGSVATPFERRPYGVELQLCQRYYERHTMSSTTYLCHGQAYALAAMVGMLPFKVQKRVTPTGSDISAAGTWSISDGAFSSLNVTVASVTLGNTTPQVGRVDMAVASGLTPGHACFIFARSGQTATVGFDAEL